jgi:hypothetical protein
MVTAALAPSRRGCRRREPPTDRIPPRPRPIQTTLVPPCSRQASRWLVHERRSWVDQALFWLSGTPLLYGTPHLCRLRVGDRAFTPFSLSSPLGRPVGDTSPLQGSAGSTLRHQIAMLFRQGSDPNLARCGGPPSSIASSTHSPQKLPRSPTTARQRRDDLLTFTARHQDVSPAAVGMVAAQRLKDEGTVTDMPAEREFEGPFPDENPFERLTVIWDRGGALCAARVHLAADGLAPPVRRSCRSSRSHCPGVCSAAHRALRADHQGVPSEGCRTGDA